MSTDRPGRSSLRIASLNLASGRDGRGRTVAAGDLPAALAPLARQAPDVVALQEVDAGQARSGRTDQAALVARELGLEQWRFAPTLIGTPGPAATWRDVSGTLRAPDDPPLTHTAHYGVALLSRAPVQAWYVLPLPAGSGRLPLRVPDAAGRGRWLTVPDEPRVAVAAELEGGALVVGTHLSFSPPTARRQLAAVRRWAAALPARGGAPRLLAGDLNLPAALLPRSARSLVRAATFPVGAPRLQLDHVVDLDDDGTPGLPWRRRRSAGSPRGLAAAGRALPLAVGDHAALVVDVLLP